MRARFLPILCLLALLAGCGSHSHKPSGRSEAGLEPEISELDALRNSRGRPLTEAESHALESKVGIAFHLTPEDTRDEKLFLQYFTGEKHGVVQSFLTRSEPYLEYVRAVLASHRLPQDLLALPYIESGYNVMAVSGSGAGGMWQFMPATAKRFGLTVDWWLDERRDPYLATVAAARYLKALHGQFGDWQLALAAYNAGEGSISRAMNATGKQSFKALASSSSMRDETRHYVPKFLAMLKITQNARKLGFNAPDMKARNDLAEVRVPGGTDLAGLAGYLGLSWERFHALNPAFRRQVSPPDRTTAAWVPKNLAGPATAFCEHREKGNNARLARSGDSWARLSRETGIPASMLCAANKGTSAPVPGQPVLIPLASCPQDAGAGESAPSGKTSFFAALTKRVHSERTPSDDDEDAPRRALAQVPAKAQPYHAQSSYKPGPREPVAPQPALYVVRQGDTLASVASKTGTSVSALASLNKTSPSQHLTPGTPLMIPAKGQANGYAEASPAGETTSLNPTPKYKIIRR